MPSQKKMKREPTARERREAEGIPYPYSAHCEGNPSQFVTDSGHPYDSLLCCRAKCTKTGGCGNTAATRGNRGVRLNHQ